MVSGILYSKKYNYFAQYCAKSGCSTLRILFLKIHGDELEKTPERGHHELKKYFPIPNSVNINNIPNYIVVRNPYTRVISMFFNKYLAAKVNLIKHAFDRNKIKVEQNTFHAFLLILNYLKIHNKINRIDDHIQEQTFNFVKNSKTKIVHLESFESELFDVYKCIINEPKFQENFILSYNEIFSKKEKKVNNTPINTESYNTDLKSMAYTDFPFGTREAPPYWTFYTTPEIVDLVYDIYENDFITFGYMKDSYPKEV